MSTPSIDTPAVSTTCHLCEKAIKHADVILIGHASDDKTISVHPACLTAGKNPKVKDLDGVHVYTEKGKAISPAKLLVVKKRIKEIYKAIAIANERRKQETK